MTILFSILLIYNHKQLPTKEDVFKITGDWSPKTEEVYLVRKIDEEWLTIFRNSHSVLVSRLEQNWLGFWEFKDDLGGEGSLASTYYPPEQNDEFTWGASGSDEVGISYYFGHIINPKIQEIKVETEKGIYDGYIPNTKAEDGEEIDVYILGENKPLYNYEGTVIAIVNRKNDDEDKLVVANQKYSIDEIKSVIHFQEQFFDIDIITSS